MDVNWENTLGTMLLSPNMRASKRSPFRFSKRGLRYVAYCIALLVYGLLGQPFPKSVGVAELAIGVFLLLAAGKNGFINVIGRLARSRQYRLPWLIFFYMLTVPTLVGVFRGWSLEDILRDVIPLFFFFQFLIFVPVFPPKLWKTLPWVLVASGLIMATRFYRDIGVDIRRLGYEFYIFKQFLSVHIPYDPVFMFGTIYLWLEFLKKPHWKRIPLLIGGVYLIGTEVAINQRAPVVISLLTFLIYSLFNTSLRSKLWITSLLAVAGFVERARWNQIALAIMAKTQSHGLGTGKLIEALVVLRMSLERLDNFIFGLGWGGLYNPPYAPLGLEVSYTHEFASYILLKNGWIGLLLVGLFVIWLLRRLFHRPSPDIILVPSVLTLLSYALFQVGYKTLTFGAILLLLIASTANRSRE